MATATEVKEVVPDLYQIKLPLPIKSLDYVYAYLAVDRDDSLLIDSGWPGEQSRIALEASLAELGMSFSEIRKVLVSHLHPDHFGLASEIQKRGHDIDVMMHRADAAGILRTSVEYDRFIDELHSWLGLQGTPPQLLGEMLEESRKTLRYFELPSPNVILEGGETINVGEKWRFEVIPTPGHTIGTVCLFDSVTNSLFSGDHILPTITPNVSQGPRYMQNPLGDYLRSLQKLSDNPAKTLLPSHEYVFSNLHERIREIEKHHEERLGETLAIVSSAGSGGISAFQIASRLHWNAGPWEKLSAWDKRAALMETLAHIDYLKATGKLGAKADGSSMVTFLSSANAMIRN